MAKLTVETKLGYQMAHIEDVYIDKNHRRKGFGSLLVQHLVDRAKSCRVERIVLGTPVPEFYTALGFREHGTYMVLKC